MIRLLIPLLFVTSAFADPVQFTSPDQIKSLWLQGIESKMAVAPKRERSGLPRPLREMQELKAKDTGPKTVEDYEELKAAILAGGKDVEAQVEADEINIQTLRAAGRIDDATKLGELQLKRREFLLAKQKQEADQKLERLRVLRGSSMSRAEMTLQEINTNLEWQNMILQDISRKR